MTGKNLLHRPSRHASSAHSLVVVPAASCNVFRNAAGVDAKTSSWHTQSSVLLGIEVNLSAVIATSLTFTVHELLAYTELNATCLRNTQHWL